MPQGLIASWCNQSVYNSWQTQLEFLKVILKDVLKTKAVFLFLITMHRTIKEVLHVCLVRVAIDYNFDCKIV